MIEIHIPGFRDLQISHVVCDYNGTLALDGVLLPGVRDSLTALALDVDIYVITADTFGIAENQLSDLPVKLKIIPLEYQAEAKFEFISALGAENVFAIGNGMNDRKMLQSAAVGVALIQREGASAATLACADVVSLNILDSLDLLRNPKRLIATLRS
ncbi:MULTISPECIES: HAD family hydrolase [unclassified Pseudomonas]|uniref:HAD family hydrolase n=1 Tax=unclassified Pseudomonas TaxID=196821 RepID=UPI0012697164|nr:MULTISPECIES: HAD hydrolase family protein [unclassified Pseudomonas]